MQWKLLFFTVLAVGCLKVLFMFPFAFSGLVVSVEDANSVQKHPSTKLEENSTISNHHKKPFQLPEDSRFGPLSGGIVIFYHVAKTGGSTVRSLFQQLARQSPIQYRYLRSLNRLWQHSSNQPYVSGETTNTTSGELCVPQGFQRETMDRIESAIEESLYGGISNKNKQGTAEQRKTLLLEFHGGPPGIGTLGPLISKWRSAAKENNIPFFAFTVVREPLSYSISYFKMFYVNCPQNFNGWCEHQDYNASQENLLQATVKNRQCFLLQHLSSIAGMDPSYYKKCSVTKEDCLHVLKSLDRNMDWVGTTEALSTETLPLLFKVLFSTTNNRTLVTRPPTNEKVSRKQPFELAMKNSTLNQLHSLTKFDQFIYNHFKEKYSLS